MSELLVLIQPWSNIEITKYLDNNFNGLYSRNDLPEIKDGAHLAKFQYQRKQTHWISLFVDKEIAVCFDYFGIEYNLPEILNKIKDK